MPLVIKPPRQWKNNYCCGLDRIHSYVNVIIARTFLSEAIVFSKILSINLDYFL